MKQSGLMRLNEYKRHRNWRRWVGTLEDVANAADLAHSSVKQIAPHPRLQIVVHYRDRTMRSSEIEVLRAAEPTRIRHISINLGDVLEPGINIEFDHEPPALTLEVFGNDRTWVDGVYDRFIDHLRPKVPFQLWTRFMTPLAATFVFALGAFLFPLILEKFGVPNLGKGLTQAEVWGTVISAPIVALLVGFSLWWGLPDFELLRPGERPRSVRLSRTLRAIGVTLFIPLLVRLIWEWLQ